MSGVIEFLERPRLDRPPVVCAFRGWNDGGEAASIAVRYLVERWDARPLATLDPEEFYDFQVNRPTVRLDNGVSRVIEWPRAEFRWATVGGRDVLLFSAPEPNIRWRAFADAVIRTALELGSEMLLTMGAFLTDVPHSRPVPLVASAASEDAAERLGLSRSQYEGPTGIVGVLHDTANRSGLPSVSLWAAVPHYLPAAPNPKAALALIQQATSMIGVEADTSSLSRAAATWEEGVARLIADNDELKEYVDRLEAAAADELRERLGADAVPSGDAIAAELERFLREQSGGTEG